MKAVYPLLPVGRDSLDKSENNLVFYLDVSHPYEIELSKTKSSIILSS